MSKLLSVIVPVYNVEKYLVKCVDSIINQTYKNLEIILVDDGSTDNSGKICDEYANKDSRIKVIHKKNGGLSSARNAGLDSATGDYIGFVDSDDFLELDIYEKLVLSLEEKKVDIVTMLMNTAFDDGTIDRSVGFSNEFLGVKKGDWVLEKICQRRMSTSVCSKVFVCSIFDKKRFDESRINEDFLMMGEILSSSVKVLITNYVGYNYLVRKNSLSRSGFNKSLQDAVYNTDELAKKIDDKNSSLYKNACCYAVYQARTCIAVMTKEQFKKNKDFICYCKDVIRRYFKYTKGLFLTRNDRLMCRIFMISPKLAKWFTDVVRK